MQRIRIQQKILLDIEYTVIRDENFLVGYSQALDISSYSTVQEGLEECKRRLLETLKMTLVNLYCNDALGEDLLQRGWRKSLTDEYVWTGPREFASSVDKGKISIEIEIPKMPSVELVVAVGNRGQIGLNGDLPWPKLRADFAKFKAVTMNTDCIAGRITWESVGKQLKGRTLHVISRNDEWRKLVHGAFSSVKDAIVQLRELKTERICVIGGKGIYADSLEYATDLHITSVDYDGEADTYFPEIDYDGWKLQEEEEFLPDEHTPLKCTYRHYVKK